jgi:hypothetical protein
MFEIALLLDLGLRCVAVLRVLVLRVTVLQVLVLGVAVLRVVCLGGVSLLVTLIPIFALVVENG